MSRRDTSRRDASWLTGGYMSRGEVLGLSSEVTGLNGHRTGLNGGAVSNGHGGLATGRGLATDRGGGRNGDGTSANGGARARAGDDGQASLGLSARELEVMSLIAAGRESTPSLE